MTAGQVNAININAGSIQTGTLSVDRIAAGSIHAGKLDAASIKANIINTNYINGLTCTFEKGQIGGWKIERDSITVGAIGAFGDIPIQIRSTASGNGYVYSGSYKPYGLTMTWHQTSNAGHFVFGEIMNSGNTVKSGFIGLQMMTWDHQEYFCLSANYTKSGSKDIYNRIAGWGFDNHRIWKNNVTLGADGSIQNLTKWQLNDDGSGKLAGGNISWDISGNVSFAPSVSLHWTNATNNALESAKTYADAKKTEAILIASTDATSKSDAAKELAQAMAFGKMLYRFPEFYHNNAIHYNGTKNYLSNATRSIVPYTGCPNSTGYILKYVSTDWHTPTDNRVGGFAFATQSRANAVFIIRIIALIPEERKIQSAHNAFGTGGKTKWLTSNIGTGKWEEYICKVTCGQSGLFTTINHFALTGGSAPSPANPVTWYIAYATVFDVRSSEKYTTTIDANGIYTGTLTAGQVNAVTINADSITTGVMSVSRIRVDANLQVGGSSLNGRIVVLNSSNATIASIDKTGLFAVAGNIAGWQINDRMFFAYNDNKTRKIVMRKNGYFYCIGATSTGTETGIDYWALHPDGAADFGNGKIRFNADGSGYLASRNLTWNTTGSLTLTGNINATGGKIGGFEIAMGRIGSSADRENIDGDGSMALYSNLFRVGSKASYVLWGYNTLSALLGGASSTGRVTNTTYNPKEPNYGICIDVRNGKKNYGISIDVKNGSVNYGVSSNAPLIAPACIGNAIQRIYFTGTGGYTMDFGKSNIFFVYCNGNVSIDLPPENHVKTHLGYNVLEVLPSDFGYVFTLIYNYNYGGSLLINNIRDHNGNVGEYRMAKGDSLTILISKFPTFHYQILNHSS